MFCSKCGAADQSAAFCQSCGAALNAAESTSQPAAAVASPAAASNKLSNMAWVFGIISIFILPYVFGTAGLVIGLVAKSKGETRATRAIVISAIGIVAGFIVQAVLLNSMNSGY